MTASQPVGERPDSTIPFACLCIDAVTAGATELAGEVKRLRAENAELRARIEELAT